MFGNFIFRVNGQNGKYAKYSKYVNKIKNNSILLAIIMIIYGIVLIIWPQLNADIIAYIISSIIIIAGAISLVKYFRRGAEKQFYKIEQVLGVIALIIGIILFLNVGIIESFIPFVLGIFVLSSGISKLQNALDLKRMNYSNWKLVMVMAVINLLFGIILVFQPLWIVSTLFRLIGIALVYCGVSDLITHFMYGKGSKSFSGSNNSGNNYNGQSEYADREDEIFQEQPRK